MNTQTFVIRGESILIGFLRGLFSENLQFYENLPNEFLYKDNVEGLKILMSEDDEYIYPVPAIIVQEGGFTEHIQSMGNHLRTAHLLYDTHYHQPSFMHYYTLHCVAFKKGAAKLLQSIVGKAIIVFRKALYACGIDNISALQGGPPSRLEPPDKNAPSQPYDCTIQFQMKMAQNWVLSRNPGIDGVDYEERIRINVISALSELEFDDDGNVTSPPEEWLSNIILVDNN